MSYRTERTVIDPNGHEHTIVHHHHAVDEDIANYRQILPQYMHDIHVANHTLLAFRPPLKNLSTRSQAMLQAVLDHLKQKGISITIPNIPNRFSTIPNSAEAKKDFIFYVMLSWHGIMSILSSKTEYGHIQLARAIFSLLDHFKKLELQFAHEARTTPRNVPLPIRSNGPFDFFE
jgi:hypothetical protein